jgi:hypothetical protein
VTGLLVALVGGVALAEAAGGALGLHLDTGISPPFGIGLLLLGVALAVAVSGRHTLAGFLVLPVLGAAVLALLAYARVETWAPLLGLGRWAVHM